MMTPDPNKSPAWIVFFLFSILLSFAVPSSSANCQDGTYEHEGRRCCLCSVGKRVVKHCTVDQDYGECEECEPKTYSSEPNGEDFCLRCTSCTHPNDNLEEGERCTPAKNTKCRCKKDHYCASSTEICRLCHPCKKCGDEGIKEACAGSNNTVCNDKSEGGSHVGKTVGIVVGVLAILVLLGVSVYVWNKRKQQQPSRQMMHGNGSDVERQHLRDVDLQRHLSDIADVIGWKLMRDIALLHKMPPAVIDAANLNYPNDSQERTIELLRKWGESQGREAGIKLVKVLQNKGKKSQAEKVEDILSCDD